jgi:hypothetical protein
MKILNVNSVDGWVAAWVQYIHMTTTKPLEGGLQT